jgi:hypothetical protein
MAGLLTATVMTLTPGAASASPSTARACGQASYVSMIRTFGADGQILDLSNYLNSFSPGRQILLQAGVFDGRFVTHTGVVAPNTSARFDYYHPTLGLVWSHTTAKSRGNCVIHHEPEVDFINLPPFLGPLTVYATYTPDSAAQTTIFLGYVTIIQ